jgi:hypothetical protein
MALIKFHWRTCPDCYNNYDKFMHLFRKLVAMVAGVALLSVGAIAAEKAVDSGKGKAPKQAKSDSSKKQKKPKDAKKGKADAEAPKLSLPILKGHDAFGLKIPYFDAEGKLQMLFNIGKASRIDDERVAMSDMQLETYDDSGEPEMTIDLPSSVLNVNTRIITTDSNVTIKRSDFEITGRSMEFNTDTKKGRLAGDVRMLIYDLGEEPAREKKEEKSPQ